MKFDLLCENILNSLILEEFIMDIYRKRQLRDMIREAMTIKPSSKRYEPLLSARNFLTTCLRNMDYMNLKSRNITDPDMVNRITEEAIRILTEEDNIFYRISNHYLEIFNPPPSKNAVSSRKPSSAFGRQRLF
jgi:hypothetical protein